MLIRIGDNVTSTRQPDGKISVVMDLKHPDGDMRIVAIINDTNVFYTHCRNMVDNPEPVDYDEARDNLIEQRSLLDTDISIIDQKIIDRDAMAKEVDR